MVRVEESVYCSSLRPARLAEYNERDTLAYLARINLPSSLIDLPPSLSLLSQLLLAHHLAVPYSTVSLHVPPNAWTGPSRPINFGEGLGMQIQSAANFERIVRGHQGGYCYANNTAFAALLRGFGFRVSEVGARVYMFRGKDPKEAGYDWSAITHETLLVDWESSEGGRWLVDVGFGGGGCPYPILLQSGSTAPSLLPSESFWLETERLPLNQEDKMHPDSTDGWTLYRRVPAREGASIEDHTCAEKTPGHWTPCYHFTLNTLCPNDIEMANHYNESHPSAVWMTFFACTLLLPDGSRKTFSYGPGHQPDRKAKIFVKRGVNGQEEGTRLIDFDTGPVGDVLKTEFGFKLDCLQ